MEIKVRVRFAYQKSKEAYIVIDFPEKMFHYYDIENTDDILNFLNNNKVIEYQFVNNIPKCLLKKDS